MAHYLCFLPVRHYSSQRPEALLKLVVAKGIAPFRSPLPCSPTLSFGVESFQYKPPLCSCVCKCLSERDATSAYGASTLSINPAVRKVWAIGYYAYLYSGLWTRLMVKCRTPSGLLLSLWSIWECLITFLSKAVLMGRVIFTLLFTESIITCIQLTVLNIAQLLTPLNVLLVLLWNYVWSIRTSHLDNILMWWFYIFETGPA